MSADNGLKAHMSRIRMPHMIMSSLYHFANPAFCHALHRPI